MDINNRTILLEKKFIKKIEINKSLFKTKLTLSYIKPKKKFFGLFKTKGHFSISDSFENKWDGVDNITDFFNNTYNYLYCNKKAYLNNDSVYYYPSIKINLIEGEYYIKYYDNDNIMLKKYKEIINILNDKNNTDKFIEL